MNPFAATDGRYNLWLIRDLEPSPRLEAYEAYRRAQIGNRERGYAAGLLHRAAADRLIVQNRGWVGNDPIRRRMYLDRARKLISWSREAECRRLP